MNFNKKELQEFYIDHLKNTILSFWMPRCLDKEQGGYLNCFDNKGENLLSKNKFIWSQGRFVWTFAKLATIEADIFTTEERETFVSYAKHGIDFLKEHAIMKDKFACAYLTDQEGNHLYSSAEKVYDTSIYADCFVIMGFAKYAEAAKDAESFDFALKLYDSVVDRIDRKDYRVLPFVRPEGRKMHGIPMISLNTAAELFKAAKALGFETKALAKDIESYYTEIMENFCDKNDRIHEIVMETNTFTNDLLGRHLNPGHTIEDLWFVLEGTELLGDDRYNQKCVNILKNTIEAGWDKEYGGIQLYSDVEGGRPQGNVDEANEGTDMVERLLYNWDSKLYWVHSESLYTTLLCYTMTEDTDLLDKYRMIHEYTFKTFPNPDKEIGEWIQVRKRDGSPDDKLVGLPVKDPFHITRNLMQVIELLD